MVKKTLLSMAIAAAVVSLAGCNVSTTDKYDNKIINEGVQYGPASSVYPIFAPEAGQVPLAIDFLFADAGASDGTTNTADTCPAVTTAINKLDGFSTVAPLYIEFSADLDPATVQAGETVILVKLANAKDHSSIDALDLVTILEATNGVPFSPKGIAPTSYEANVISMNDGRTPAIQILLKEPLEPKTKYLVMLTNGIKGANGETIGQSTTYAHAIGSDEIVNPDLAPVRGALQGWQQLAQGFLASGTPLVANAKGKAVFNYAFTTGGTDDVLKAMAAPGTFLQGQVAAQITSIDIGEGAITAAVIGGGGNQAAADAQLDTIAGLVATQINAENPGTLPTTDGATIRPILKSTESLQPYYLAGLRMAITTSKGAPVIAAIDTPKSRDYNAIISAPNTAVPVSYDAFLTAQVTPKVEAQITSIAVGEGAITQAVIGGGGNQAAADAQLDTIAGLVATQINAENPGTLPTTDGATIRPILKSTESLQPYYLTDLRTAITTSQVDALSSKGNIYQGGLSIPNYLPASEAGKADGELGTWVASADAATALGLDAAPTDVDGSTNVTYRFPFAKNLGMNTVPVMATLPDATACPKPADGYPVVIYQHGITVDRTAGVLVGNALATSPVCTAMVAIDHTMHGVAPGNATGLVFSTEKVASSVNLQDPSTYTASPFAAVRAATLAQTSVPWLEALGERHNNVGKDASSQNVAMKRSEERRVGKECRSRWSP